MLAASKLKVPFEGVRGSLSARRTLRISFQTQAAEIADVSPALETIRQCKYPEPLAKLRNRTQEADGSIPFSSTELLRFLVLIPLRSKKRIGKRLG